MVLSSISIGVGISIIPIQANKDFNLLAQKVKNYTDSHINNTTSKNWRESIRRTDDMLRNQASFLVARVYFSHTLITHTLGLIYSGIAPRMANFSSASTTSITTDFIGSFAFIDDQDGFYQNNRYYLFDTLFDNHAT